MVYIEFAISLIKILERANGKTKTHCTVSSLFAQYQYLWSKETLCLRNLVNLELANCNWNSLFLILGFREFPQVDRFMLLGFSLLDPPSWVSNSSWPSGMGEHILSVKDFKMGLWVSHLNLAFLFLYLMRILEKVQATGAEWTQC